MDANCCAECGYTTTNLKEFTVHIEQHEEDQKASCKGGDWSSNSSSEGESHSLLLSPASSPPPSRAGSDGPAEEEMAAVAETKPTTIQQALALDGIITAPTSSSSDEEKMVCSSSSSSGSVSPNEGEITTITHAAHVLLNQSKLFSPPAMIQDMQLTPETPTKKGNKPMHSCPHCNFTTYMSQHMKSHLEAHERHQGQMYQCDICHMQFSQKANMHRHRMRHSGVKPYECRYCKKRFFRKDQMQEHSMTHIKTGADFDCPVAACVMQFPQHSALRAHLDDAHTITSNAPASCKRCSLLFANSRRLLLHYQTKHDEGDTSGVAMAMYDEDAPDSPRTPPKKRRTNMSTSSCGSVPPAPSTPIPVLPSASSMVSSAACSPFMPPASVITSLAGAQNNNHLALLQSRFEDIVKMNAFGGLGNLPHGMPSAALDAVASMVVPPSFAAAAAAAISAMNAAAAAPVKQERADSPKNSSLSPEYDSNSGYSALTSQQLLLALSNQASSPFFSIDSLTDTKDAALRLWSGENLSAFAATVSDDHSHSPSVESSESIEVRDLEPIRVQPTPQECKHCEITFKDKALYVLHQALHSDMDPWTCKLCGESCDSRFAFATHLITKEHAQ